MTIIINLILKLYKRISMHILRFIRIHLHLCELLQLKWLIVQRKQPQWQEHVVRKFSEVWSLECGVIRFWNVQQCRPILTNNKVYGDNVMNKGAKKMVQWKVKHSRWRTFWSSSLSTEVLNTKTDQKIHEDRDFTLDSLHIPFPKISKSRSF